MSTSVESIIQGLHQGNPHVMKQMFELYYAPLCHYAKRYVAVTTIAEEIVSNVMYKIWQNRDTTYHANTFREYLYTSTRNTAINHLKQQQNIRKLSDNWAEQLRDELITETPLDQMIISELQIKLDDLIEALPEQCRKVFRMSRIDDLTYEEIALQMDISVNTVKHHIKTALHKLRIGLSDFLIWIFLLGNTFF